MRKLTMEELNRIEFFGGAKIGEDEYTFKFYEGKSEIRMNGELVARIDNSKPVTDESRVEYVETGWIPKWIPVEESLPGVPRWPEWPVYLTCDKYGIIEVQHWYCGWNCSGIYGSDEVDRTYENKNVVAWMPLPDTYKEEKENEEV